MTYALDRYPRAPCLVLTTEVTHRGGRGEAAPAVRGRGRGRGRAIVPKKRRWNSDEDFSSGATSEEEEDRPEYHGEPVRLRLKYLESREVVGHSDCALSCEGRSYSEHPQESLRLSSELI